jgi:hypothetical protein
MSRRKDINILFQTGITSDNKKVIGGIFTMFQVNGIPLEIMFEFLQNNNSVPDWIDFYKGAKKHGMNHNKIIFLLRDGILDGYDPQWSDIVIANLNKIFGEEK